MASEVIWHEQEFLDDLERHFNARMEKAADHLAGVVRDNLNNPAPGPSSPGTFPNMHSGGLANSIISGVDAEGGFVGSIAPQALMLEKGAGLIEARPFLVPSLDQAENEMAQILLEPID